MTHRDWNEYIPYVVFADNTAVQDTTQMAPFKLLYGRDSMLPTEPKYRDGRDKNNYINYSRSPWFGKTKNRNKQIKDKSRYDERHWAVHYNVGDQVKILYTETTGRQVRQTPITLVWALPNCRKTIRCQLRSTEGKRGPSYQWYRPCNRMAPYHEPWGDQEYNLRSRKASSEEEEGDDVDSEL